VKTLLIFLFVLIMTSAQAAITVTARGTGTNNTSAATFLIAPTSNLAAGSSAALCLSLDNANGVTANVPTTITDSVGNIWYLELRVASSGINLGVEIAIYITSLSTAWTTSDSLTLTFTTANVTAKTYAIWEIATSAGNRVVPSTARTSTTTSGTPSILTVPNVNNAQMVIGICGAESADTFVDDADTTNGSWSTGQHTGAGTGITGASITTQTKVVNADGPQTYNPTLTSADLAIGILILAEAPLNVRELGTNQVGETTTTITPKFPLAAGSFAVFCIAADNNGANGAVVNLPAGPITDSVGNTWTQRQDVFFDNGVAAAGVEVGIYTSTLTTNLTITDNIPFGAFPVSTVSKVWSLFEFAPGAGQTLSYGSSGSNVGSTTATPTVTTSSVNGGDIVVGVGGAEGGNTWVDDTDTSNGSWSFGAKLSYASTLLNNALLVQYKTTTGAGTQTFDPTLTSADTQLAWLSISVVTAGGGQFFIMWP
jgi:hypothetical protein